MAMTVAPQLHIDSKVRVPIATLLGAVFALLATTAGATYAITTLATQAHVNALQLQIALLDTRVRELQAELQRRQQSLATTDVRLAPAPAIGPENYAVVFKTPLAESEVAQFADVEYSVLGKVPDGYTPVLFIKDTVSQYWPYGSSLTGVHPRVQFGVATDSGRHFEIGVLLTREHIEMGKPLRVLPAGASYESISVKRR